MKTVGYLFWNIKKVDIEEIDFLKKCKYFCEELIIGLPTDDLMFRMTDCQQNRYDVIKKFLRALRDVDEVIPVDTGMTDIKKIHEQYPFQVYFYGTEYGQMFCEDKHYLEEKGVKFISLQPDALKPGREQDSFRCMLENLMPDKKLVLFGTGAYFDDYMMQYGKEFPPAYAVDNDSGKWGQEKAGIQIKSPSNLQAEDHGKTMIILCCKNYEAVLEQIHKTGEFDYRPMRYENAVALIEEYCVALREEEKYLKKVHDILWKNLLEFDKVCKEQKLHYYMIGGSLIGVLRHKDFIPWDDDLDIAMTRADYEVFKKKAPEIWKDGSYELIEPDKLGGGAFYDCMPRLVYMKEHMPSKTYNKVYGKAREKIMNRCVIDIFLLDNASDKMWKHKLVTSLMKADYALLMGHRAYVDYTTYDRVSALERFVIRCANSVGSLIPSKILFGIYEKLSRYAEHEPGQYYFESDGVMNYMPMLHKKEMFREGSRLPMRNGVVNCPKDVDGSLKSKGYGDYMQLPPVNRRKPEHTARDKGVIW